MLLQQRLWRMFPAPSRCKGPVRAQKLPHAAANGKEVGHPYPCNATGAFRRKNGFQIGARERVESFPCDRGRYRWLFQL
jgi:hypothetical protein